MSVARIVRAILNNEQAVLPVSAYLDGEYGEKDLFTGVPSVVDQGGVREIIELNIDPAEKQKFAQSCSQLREVDPITGQKRLIEKGEILSLSAIIRQSNWSVVSLS